jgi:hypothetical protein
MMLYDRVMERVFRYSRRVGLERLTPTENQLGAMLFRAQVYDLSGCVILHSDWLRERDRAVPKRSPHPVVWAEWPYTETNGLARMRVRCGALVMELDKSKTSCPPVAEQYGGETLQERWDITDLCYEVLQFFTTEESYDAEGKPQHKEYWYEPEVSPYCCYITCMEDGSRFRSNVMFSLPPKEQEAAQAWLRSQQHFGLSLGYWQYPGETYNPTQYPWPPFMAFALLHCKNVVTEEHIPGERTQRRAAKAGKPERCSYKTLRVEVPATVHKKERYDEDDGDDEGPRVRFHIVSGHFKNLQHPRYKKKGWHWWPAHWRGDPSLGTVVKDYRLTSAEGGSA